MHNKALAVDAPIVPCSTPLKCDVKPKNVMSISIRHFVVSGSDVQRLSQKKRQGFYLRKENTLPEYSGQTIKIADVCIELVDRKPYKIIRIDCMKHKVDENGGLDTEYEKESGKHFINIIETPKVISQSSVLNATSVFEAKRLEGKYTWKLSDVIALKIAESLNV